MMLRFMLISGSGIRERRQLNPPSLHLDSQLHFIKTRRLTWLPDALRRGQSVTEDAFVPQASEAVDDAPALVQHCALHLVLVGVRTPITRLEGKHKVVGQT